VEPSGRQEWYVWTVRPGKFEIVKDYIESKVTEVKEVLYPAITTETVTKKGEIKRKTSPLYVGYLFLQYHHDEGNPVTWWKLNKHPFITRYIGPCTAQDLASAQSLKKVEKIDDELVREFRVGDEVRVDSGVFIGFRGSVKSKNRNSIGVELRSLGKTLKVVFSPEDLVILKERGDGTP
jgi:transcriptional antiterminator NusG